MNELYLLPIVFLLPLSALTVVVQVNPYNALVMRGILGAISALIYAILGAADVALTDALVGTMLSITLYAIAVRSSLSMRIGGINLDKKNDLLLPIRASLSKHYMRLEVLNYDDENSLKEALLSKEIHSALTVNADRQELMVRVPRLHEILHAVSGLDVILWGSKQ